MKDRELREEFREKFAELTERLGKLPELIVRHCKKCEHDTLQVVGCRSEHLLFSYGDDFDYKCLNCGVKWNCYTARTCEEVDKPKPKEKTTKK